MNDELDLEHSVITGRGKLLLPIGVWDELCDHVLRNWVLVAGIVLAGAVVEPGITIPLEDHEVSLL